MAAVNEVVKYNDELSYIIRENGYEIHLNGNPWITQFDQYSRIYKPEGTFEENCLIQLEELTRAKEEQPAIEGDPNIVAEQ